MLSADAVLWFFKANNISLPKLHYFNKLLSILFTEEEIGKLMLQV